MGEEIRRLEFEIEQKRIISETDCTNKREKRNYLRSI